MIDNTFWQAITENNYEGPEGHGANDLAPDLLPLLTSPNPDEHDGFGYMILARWTRYLI